MGAWQYMEHKGKTAMSNSETTARPAWRELGPLGSWCIGVLAWRYHEGNMVSGYERWRGMFPGERDSWMQTARRMLAGDYANDE